MPRPKPLHISQETESPAIDLALDTIKIKKQALIFANTKRGAEKAAEDIAVKIKLETLPNKAELETLSYEVLNCLSKPTKQCERLARCVRKGVAFHHAGLVHEQKTLIEDYFRQGKIKIICCTPTLAYGLNLPAFRAIIKDLKRYGHQGLSWIPVLEYEQMCGRCGRPGYDSWGEAIAVAANEKEKEKITEQYLEGETEGIFSKLAVEPVLRTYVLSLIASEFVDTEKGLMQFFHRTFWAHQYVDMKKLEKTIRKMIDLLSDFGFIISSQDMAGEEFISAKALAEENKLSATKIGKRVAELYIDPLTAHNMIIALERAANVQVSEFSFLHLVSSCLELRPLLRVKTSEYDTIQQKLAELESDLIEPEPSLYDPDYDSFLDAVKTAFFFADWMDERDEEELLEHYNIRPGEIRVKLDLADWLLYAAEELARLMKKHMMIKEIIKTRLRLRYGVKEELLPLLKLEGIGRVRARKLFNNKIKDIGDVKAADLMKLVQIVGKNTAISIKKQVGHDVGKIVVPENKRKGQISLKDY